MRRKLRAVGEPVMIKDNGPAFMGWIVGVLMGAALGGYLLGQVEPELGTGPVGLQEVIDNATAKGFRQGSDALRECDALASTLESQRAKASASRDFFMDAHHESVDAAENVRTLLAECEGMPFRVAGIEPFAALDGCEAELADEKTRSDDSRADFLARATERAVQLGDCMKQADYLMTLSGCLGEACYP